MTHARVAHCVGGVIGEPCGVPAPVGEVTPPSSTPIRSHARISFSIDRSTTRRATWTISASWSIVPKQSRMSASNTHSRRWLAATRTASHASIADLLGRNP